MNDPRNDNDRTPKRIEIVSFDPGASKTAFAHVSAVGASVTFIEAALVENNWFQLRGIVRKAPYVALERARVKHSFGHSIEGIVESVFATGRLHEMADICATLVVPMTAGQWRSMICGKPNASDLAVRTSVEHLVKGLPKKTNVHVRDALGLAVACAWHLSGRKAAA